jgi:SAM-dependent methyltransferase
VNPKLQGLQAAIRAARLLPLAEEARLWANLVTNARRNWRFVRENPGFPVPAVRLAYDAYGTVYLGFYRESGVAMAQYLAKIVASHHGRRALKVLEWGCGPGRVVRHLPPLLDGAASVFASDCNRKSIAWCLAHLSSSTFVAHTLEPPLPFDGDFFDCVYGISVITHLSKRMHHAWLDELVRVTRPGGIILLTSHGERYRRFLLPDEVRRFDGGGLVVRDKVREGTKMFTAFHSPAFMRTDLFKDLEILGHRDTGLPYMDQDLWIVRSNPARRHSASSIT